FQVARRRGNGRPPRHAEISTRRNPRYLTLHAPWGRGPGSRRLAPGTDPAVPRRADAGERLTNRSVADASELPSRLWWRDDGGASRVSDWPWPPELEGTVAAPDSHRVLLESPRARVLEILIEPGAREPEHVHRHPSVMIVDGPARIRYHQSGALA